MTEEEKTKVHFDFISSIDTAMWFIVGELIAIGIFLAIK